MDIKRSIKSFPGVIRGVRLGKRIFALARRTISNLGALEPEGRNVKAILAFSDNRNRFVGYYDHSPFKPNDERLLLIHSTSRSAWRRPSPFTPVTIEIINHQDG